MKRKTFLPGELIMEQNRRSPFHLTMGMLYNGYQPMIASMNDNDASKRPGHYKEPETQY